MCFRLEEGIYIGNYFGEILDGNIFKSVVPVGLESMAGGFVPAVEARREEIDVGDEF